MYVNQITEDSKLAPALDNVGVLADTNKVVLSLDAAGLKELTDAINAFRSKFNASVSAKAAAKAAVSAKDIQRKATMVIVGKYIKLWRANQAVPDALLAQLGVAPHVTPPTKTAPMVPSNLKAKADALGNIVITWKANGNKTGTQYVVETRTGPNVDWQFLGATTRGKAELSWAVGTYFAARITAQRDGQHSLATVPVVLWDNSSGVSLEVAA